MNSLPEISALSAMLFLTVYYVNHEKINSEIGKFKDWCVNGGKFGLLCWAVFCYACLVVCVAVLWPVA